MTEKNRRGVAIAVLAEAFRQTVTPELLAAYEMGLSDIDPQAIERAVQSCIRSDKFMPTCAELRNKCGCGVQSLEDEAIVAWQSVVKAVSACGSYKAVDFEDKRINAAVRSLGGWPELCARSGEDFDKWARKDFLTAYKAFSRAGVSEDAGRPLAGLSQSGEVRRINGDTHMLEAKPAVAIPKADADRKPRIARGRHGQKAESVSRL